MARKRKEDFESISEDEMDVEEEIPKKETFEDLFLKFRLNM